MDLRLMKKGFAFSFLAMFFAFLIFAFGSYYLFQSDLTINDEYKQARVQAIQSEIDYFQESYFQNVVSFSLYNVLEQIQQNKTLFDSIKGNHTKLNDLIYEGISRGTLGGENIGVLENKTLEYFVEIFNEDFLENHKGNFNYTLVGINIYERNPYFLSLDVAGFYNISIEDNLSSWEFIEFQTIGFPIADLTNPSYLGSAENQSIRFSEFYLPEEDLDEETFNETLKESYVKVYVQNDFKYSIGNSFLKRMLGISRSSYEEVVGFWSFDYDEEYGGVYDNSRHIEIGDFYSNAQLLLNFNDGNANDSSVNENDGIVSGATNISGCIFDNCYSFGGAGNNIEIEDDTSLNYNESFSISTWFRTLNVGDHQTIIAKSDGGLYMDAGYMLNTNTSGSVRFAVSDGTDSYGFDSVEEYDDGFWHHVVVVVDKEEQNVTLYIDGINSEYRLIGGGNFGATFPTGDYSNSENLTIGSESDGEHFFNGDIDELSIYSKVVSKEDVAKLYRFKRILRLDYVDSEFGKSAYFDGKDDVLIISDSDDLSLGNEFSVGMWVKPYSYNESYPFFLSRYDSSLGETYKLGFNDTSGIIEARLNDGDMILKSQNPLKLNKWSYIVMTFDKPDLKLYINGLLENQTNFNQNLNSSMGGFLTLGADYDGAGDINQHFNGEIDEVKIYEKELSKQEISNSYYNFDSLEKGCCNFISLVNYNELGYNSSAYLENISSSSKLFYDKFDEGIDRNISLYQIRGMTSFDTDEEYYNLLLDECLMEAFHVLNFNESIVESESYHVGEDNGNCSKLIQDGIY